MFRKVASLVALFVLAVTAVALAADPPKWVATIYMEAQRSVGLRWQPAPGATAYKVLRSETKGAGYKEIAAPTAPQYFDAAVEPGSTYFYVLQAVAAEGLSANSEEKSVLIPGQKKAAQLPPVEWRALQATSTTEFGKTTYKISLQWKANSAAIAYNIYRSMVQGKDYQLVGSVSEDQYVDVSAQEEGKTYYYVVTGLDNTFQESKYSEEKSALLEAKKAEKKKEALPNPKLAIKTSELVLTIDDTPEHPISSVGDVVIDSRGNIIFTDVLRARVFVFGPDGKYKNDFGEKGPQTGRLMFPTGLGIDADDNIYITDRATKSRIVIFTIAGKFLKEIVAPPADPEYLKTFSKNVNPSLRDVAVAKDGRIYAVDNALHRVLIFAADGKFIKDFGRAGSGPGEFNTPGWCAINAKGELHVTGGFNRRMDAFDLDGNFIRTYGTSKSFIGSFIGPTGVTFDREGNSIVADATLTTIQAFSPEGQYLYHLTGEKAEIEPESKQRPLWAISGPSGLFFDLNNNVLAFAIVQAKQIMVRKINP